MRDVSARAAEEAVGGGVAGKEAVVAGAAEELGGDGNAAFDGEHVVARAGADDDASDVAGRDALGNAVDRDGQETGAFRRDGDFVSAARPPDAQRPRSP